MERNFGDGARSRPRIGKGRTVLSGVLLFAAAIALLAIGLKLANPLPSRNTLRPDPPRLEGSGSLAQSAGKLAAAHPDMTGIRMLTDSFDAFATRLAMVRNAERTIDAQYYIWQNDLSGRMLISEIVAAADRGVRVRILIDDNPTAGLDPMWAGVMRHPGIAVRIFNPLMIRGFRPANYLFDFPRLNRRMHNKSLTVDGVATVVGGRNIGDEYFGAKDKGLFIDVDVLAVGASVGKVEDQFERYWASGPVHDATAILDGRPAMTLDALRRPELPDSDLARDYTDAAERQVAALDFIGEDDWIWAKARLVADDPAKGSGEIPPESLMASQIAPLFESARDKVDVVSGYFVPGEEGTDLLANLARRGVHTRVATNSLQVTDVPIVHSGYSPYRPALLKAGVELYEARPLDGTRDTARALGHTKFSGGGESVHAKTFAVDRRTIYIGSFNLDPRSALLNCEMGLVIESPDIAGRPAQALDERLPVSSYRVAIDGGDHMTWSTMENGEMRVWRAEPGTGPGTRAMIAFLSILPIEWLL